MGYLFLFLALAFGIIKAYCGKRTSSSALCSYDAIVITTVRMACCIAISLAVVLLSRDNLTVLVTPKMLAIGAFSGISIACFTVCWLLSVRSLAYMMVEVFVMGGTVITLAFSYILYKEQVRGMQIVGIVLLVIAVYCMCTNNTRDRASLSKKSFLLLLLCAVSSAFSDFSQKMFVKEVVGVSASVFNLYTYLFAAVVLFFASFVFKLNEKGSALRKPLVIVKPILHYVLIMALCLFLNSFFKTNAAKYIDAVSLYPLNQGCAVLLSLAMSVLIFKEKATPKGLFGIALSIVAMILINVN